PGPHLHSAEFDVRSLGTDRVLRGRSWSRHSIARRLAGPARGSRSGQAVRVSRRTADTRNHSRRDPRELRPCIAIASELGIGCYMAPLFGGEPAPAIRLRLSNALLV